MELRIPDLSLVVLIGVSGSGKSTFARKHFKPTEILSSDYFRGLVCDDESDQNATAAAFELLYLTASKRLMNGKLTVIDATNVQPDARKHSLDLARRYHVQPVAIVLEIPEPICQEHNRNRLDRQVPEGVIRNQIQQLKRYGKRLRDEGFRFVHALETLEQVAAATVIREPLPVDRKQETGPFDIIGDVHGCLEELRSLFNKLGYSWNGDTPIPPENRKALFVGDLVDRGPDSPGVMQLVMNMMAAGHAFCVRGNHDDKLCRKLKGRQVSITHGLDLTLEQLERYPAEAIESFRDFLDSLPSHLVLDGGKLVIAHAGMKAELQGRISDRVRAFGLYGETTGESDEFGLPVRLIWANDYHGKATVVYGHTPVAFPEWINRCLCIDTGCVFGGSLSALRYPEREIVSVPALKEYAVAKRPFLPPASLPPAESAVPSSNPAESSAANSTTVMDDMLDLKMVLGKQIISTRWMNNLTIREGQSAAALEMVSRFAVNPRWLIYLPPTMSPCETSSLPDFLEHPAEAFAYFQRNDVSKVICEQKHMGSRAILIVGKNESAIQRRFGIYGEGFGICMTRTGRRFFDDLQREIELITLVRDALTGADFWNRFQTDWFCLDAELMPWSAKAQELLRNQYAATGSAGRVATQELLRLLPANDPALEPFRLKYEQQSHDIHAFISAYRQYCWPVDSIRDYRLAPFHLLASEGKVHTDQDQIWHVNTLAELVRHGEGLLIATPYEVVDLQDPAQVEATTRWWLHLTENGGEGMVVKPLAWLQRGKRGLIQPAMKVRGREYLRIIYGPEYTRPDYLTRLRQRGLGIKQSLAMREFCLGMESLERFIAKEPLRKIHECVFAILALECEPIDPRL